MNIFNYFPTPELVKIIGEEKLDSIKNILLLINSNEINPDSVYSKEFLANYTQSVSGSEFLKNKNNFKKLLNFLTDEQIKNLSNEILTNSFDERKDNLRALIDSFNSKTSKKIFSDFFDIDFSSFDSQINVQPDDILIPANSNPYKPLKDYQFEVLFKSMEKLEVPYSRFILQMPTGSGKTRTAMEIVSNFLNQFEDSSVIWLAHSVELCDQASSCFLEIWPHLAKKQIKFKRHYSSYSVDLNNDNKIDFLCAGFQSAYASIKKDNDIFINKLNSKRLIVIDEAHKVVANTYEQVTRSFGAEGSNFMGLTATPGRSYKILNSDEENQKLADFFFEDIISFKPDKNLNSIEYLRNKGILAKASLDTLMIDSSIDLSDNELKHLEESFDFSKGLLSKIGKIEIRNAEIIQYLLRICKNEKYKSIIYFATSVEQSKLIASLLTYFGIQAVHVDGETSSQQREQSIIKFRSQNIQVLCNYEVLATGFDAPLVDCVFLARPTASVVLYSQMVGRGLRGPAIGGKKECLVVNVRDNFNNFPSIDNIYNVFEDYWK